MGRNVHMGGGRGHHTWEEVRADELFEGEALILSRHLSYFRKVWRIFLIFVLFQKLYVVVVKLTQSQVRLANLALHFSKGSTCFLLVL